MSWRQICRSSAAGCVSSIRRPIGQDAGHWHDAAVARDDEVESRPVARGHVELRLQLPQRGDVVLGDREAGLPAQCARERDAVHARRGRGRTPFPEGGAHLDLAR
jgi:hypothetical protein